MEDHINAELVSGTLKSKQDAVDYLTWTYFFRRLVQNPAYYDLLDTKKSTINEYLSSLIDYVVENLERSGCLVVDDDEVGLTPTILGRIASYYYLKHETMRVMDEELKEEVRHIH